MINFISYAILRCFGWGISFLPYRTLHGVGRVMGVVIYHLHRSFRKKAMTNLAIAYGKTMSEEERRKIAKRSFQNLTITCFEFFRLKKSKDKLSEIVELAEGHEAFSLLKQKQGVVFLTGHQANWEIPFIGITAHTEGIAIGRPIKNKWLYNWVLSVREMNGGKIVMPKQAIKKGTEALREGKFLGIVGDQAFPESSYSYPLFGTRAWTTTTPALIAYKTNSPLVVATSKRVKGKYYIEGSPLMWPDTTKPLKEEVIRLMNASMSYLEKSIQSRPHEWLWQHDRWKQGGVDHVKREFRYGFILTLLPKADSYLTYINLLKEIYPRSFLTFLVPEKVDVNVEGVEMVPYVNEEGLCLRDWRYQLVIDLVDSSRARKHYAKLGAFKTLNLKKLKKLSSIEGSLDKILKHALCKPGAFEKKAD